MTVALKLVNLQKTYPNNVQALKGINLEVKKGDFFALLGPNGAGKSTAIGIISSLVNKSSGEVWIFDKNLETDPSQAKSYIGLVPQEFNFGIFEKVHHIVFNQAGYYGIPKAPALEQTEKYLKLLDLWGKKDQQARSLSGGMKRRLMIARALIHNPKLLILDEPTAGVDIEIRRSMWDFLREINRQGTTIILTTHYLEEAESLCRNIAIINRGEIIVHSSMKSLLTKLDKDTLVFELRDSLSSEQKMNLQNQSFPIREIDSHTIEVDIPRGQGPSPLFALMQANKIHIQSLRNKTNRLEELFVQLTEQK